MTSRPPVDWLARAPLAAVLVGEVAGIVCRQYSASIIPLIVAAALCVALAFMRRAWIAAASGAFVAGWMVMAVSLAPTFDITRHTVPVEGVVYELSNRDRSTGIVVDGTLDGAPCRTYVVVPERSVDVAIGDTVRLVGTCGPARFTTDLPGENDMSAYYRMRGIGAICFADGESMEVSPCRGFAARSMLYWGRNLAPRVAQTRLDAPVKSLVEAVLVGDTDDIDVDRREQYSAAGVAHVLALSGMHLSIIAMVFAVVLLPFGVFRHRRIKWALTICAVWAFVIVTGLRPSVVRSAVMLTCVLVGMSVERRRSSVNFLCLAGIIILTVDPYALYSLGAQLSFAATMGIVVIVPMFTDMVYSGGWLRRILLSMVVTTVAATAFTLPLIAWAFHRIPLWFIPVNMVVSCVLPVFMILSVVLLCLDLTSGFASVITYILNVLGGALDGATSIAASLPCAQVTVPEFSPWALLPAYVGLGLLAMAMYKHRLADALWGVGTLFAAVIIVMLTSHRSGHDGIYVTSRTDYAEVVIVHADTLTLFTAHPQSRLDGDLRLFADRHRDFIRRGEFAVTRVGRIDVGGLGWTESYDKPQADRVAVCAFKMGERPVMLVAGTSIEHTDTVTRAPYILVTRHFYDDITALARAAHADTIVLCADIPGKKRHRFARELTTAGVPWIDTYEYPLAIHPISHNIRH